MEFPRLVYKSATQYQLVETQEEYDAAIKDGWYSSVPDALEGKKPETAAEKKAREKAEAEEKAKQEEADEHLKLVEEAIALKIDVKEDWTDKQIQAAIKDAKK